MSATSSPLLSRHQELVLVRRSVVKVMVRVRRYGHAARYPAKVGLLGEASDRGLMQGALVSDVAPLSAAAAAGVKAGDILLAIDDVPLAEDGSIPFRDAERIGCAPGEQGERARARYDFLVSRRVVGDSFRIPAAALSTD
eukprot:Skav218404  [mRNA]  locus=scaffold1349:64449:77892:+ [translate_table: standard]